MKAKTKKVEQKVVVEQPESTHASYRMWHYFSIICILIAATWAVYWSTLSYSFQFDDLANISKHFEIRFHTFWDLFFSGTRWISYWLNAIYYRFSQFNPFLYRLGDVIIHTINGLLLFGILSAVLSRFRTNLFVQQYALHIATLTAFLFLLHPVQTQTVCYVIQGQLEGLAACAILSAVALLLWYSYTQNLTQKILAASLLFVCSALATGTKEIAMVTPMLLLIVDWFFIAQGSWEELKGRWFIHAGVFGTVGALYLYLLKPNFFMEVFGCTMRAHNNQGNVITAVHGEIITPFTWFISQFKVILHYMLIFIWPFNISMEYDWKLVAHPLALDCIVPCMILASIMYEIVLLLRWQKNSVVAFGLLWFFISMAPRTSIIPSSELIADYKTYLGSIGILLCIAIGIIFICARGLQKYATMRPLPSAYAQTLLILILVAPLSYATWQRSKVWSSGVSFWEDTVLKAPGKARVHNNYGVELSYVERYEEAIEQFKKAIELDNAYFDPWNNIAVAYMYLSQVDNAIAAIQQSLALNPLLPEGYNNLSAMYKQKGDLANAEKALLNAVQLRPYYGKAWYNLGLLYIELDNVEKACECFKTCCYKADLDEEMGYNAYAKACIQAKNYDEAIRAYRDALRCTPQSGEAFFNLANAYFLAERYEEALPMYLQLQAHQAAKDDPRLLINIGETYFELGQPANALTYFERLSEYKKHMPSLYVRLAKCHALLNDAKQARTLLKELFALKPSATVREEANRLLKTLA